MKCLFLSEFYAVTVIDMYLQQVADGIYEELDSRDEKLNLGITLISAVPSDLITPSASMSLPVTSTSSKLIKQEDSTSEEYIEVFLFL